MNIDVLHESVCISILKNTAIYYESSSITVSLLSLFVHCSKQSIVNCSILCYIIKSLSIQVNGPLG